MVNKNSLLVVAVAALVVGVVVPSLVGAVAPCPDYSGKVVKAGAEYWLIQDGQRWSLVDREAASTWDKPIWSARPECVNGVPDSGGMLSFRAGTRLLKKAGTDAVYASGPNGALHLIDSPEVAAQWYGPKWGSRLRTVSESTFAKYHLAEPVTPDTLQDSAIVRQSGKSQWYQVRGGELVKITGTIRAAIYNNTLVLPAAVFNKIPLSATTIPATEILTIKTPKAN